MTGEGVSGAVPDEESIPNKALFQVDPHLQAGARDIFAAEYVFTRQGPHRWS